MFGRVPKSAARTCAEQPTAHCRLLVLALVPVPVLTAACWCWCRCRCWCWCRCWGVTRPALRLPQVGLVNNHQICVLPTNRNKARRKETRREQLRVSVNATVHACPRITLL